ncbi:peptidoglycan-binding protein [Paracoccaceae bacterium]|nr:peptidoglycan-binding protein [Paracoccaceae bacterium]
MSYANGDKYVGFFQAGKPNGQGRLELAASGNVYEGTYKDGLFDGEGTYTFANGDTYVGMFENDMFNGEGTLDLVSSGNKYIGQYEDDLFQGQGAYIYANGDKYVGSYHEGAQHGRGTKTFANGDVYVGAFKDDRFEGQGVYTYANGKKYDGAYKDNLQDGQGTMSFANGHLYVGEFKDNLFNGQGTYTYADGSTYVGGWKDNKEHGQGRITYANGDTYVGEFAEGLNSGQGEFTYTDGSIYIGDLKGDRKHGQGTLTSANGSEYVGSFKEDLFNGEGTHTEPDGSQYVGEWRNNKQLAAVLDRVAEYEENSVDASVQVENTSQIIDMIDLENTKFELTDEQKIELQTTLKERGFYSGAIDGDIGPASKRAIKSWQEDRAYTATGELTVGQRDEILLVGAISGSAENAVDFLVGIEVETEKAVVTSQPLSTIGQRITSIEAEITNPTFDLYSCAFNLEFTNSASGKSFDVVMYAEGGNGKFTASQNDIQEALADRELTAADNDWTQLKVKAKKFDNPNVVCQPKNNLSYVIKKDSRENIFEIDPDGHLTVKGLQIIGIAENDTTKIAEREVDQRITSVVGQIANTDFEFAKCSFILEFTNSSSGKSFDLVMNPVNGEFIATKNDIEDALADAGLTDKQNEWPLLTGQVKKFDYPFVSCLPANQIIYGISRDATANTFKISQEGQLTINNVSLITANARIYSDKKKEQVKAKTTQQGQIEQPENENFVWYELIKKANISYAIIAKNNFLSLGFSNVEVFQIRQNNPEHAIALGPFKNKISMETEVKILIGKGRLAQYDNNNFRAAVDYYLKVQ